MGPAFHKQRQTQVTDRDEHQVETPLVQRLSHSSGCLRKRPFRNAERAQRYEPLHCANAWFPHSSISIPFVPFMLRSRTSEEFPYRVILTGFTYSFRGDWDLSIVISGFEGLFEGIALRLLNNVKSSHVMALDSNRLLDDI